MTSIKHAAFVNAKNGRIKRPPNAFILFSHHIRPYLKRIQVLHGKPLSAIPRIIGTIWKSLTVGQRKSFKDHADFLETLHRQQYPEFVPSHRPVIVHYGPTLSRKGSLEASPRPIPIQPLPGPVSPVRPLSPVRPPWCDRGRRSNPIPTAKPLPKPIPTPQLTEKRKVIIKDPSKVKFRIVPKYRPDKYVCRQIRQKELDHEKLKNATSTGTRGGKNGIEKAEKFPDDKWKSWDLQNLSDTDFLALLDEFDLQKNSLSNGIDLFKEYATSIEYSPSWIDQFSPNISSLFWDGLDLDCRTHPLPVKSNTSEKKELQSNNPEWFDHFSPLPVASECDCESVCHERGALETSLWWQEFDFLNSPAVPARKETSISPCPQLDQHLPEDPLFGLDFSSTETDRKKVAAKAGKVSVMATENSNNFSSRDENGLHPDNYHALREEDFHNNQLDSTGDLSDSPIVTIFHLDLENESQSRRSTGEITEEVSEVQNLSDQSSSLSFLVPDGGSILDSGGAGSIRPSKNTLSQDSTQEFSYTTTPTWESMVKLTPSIDYSCVTRFFTDSSESSLAASHYKSNSLLMNSILSDSSNAKALSIKSRPLISSRTSTPVMPPSKPAQDMCEDANISPANLSCDDSLDNESIPYISPFLSNLAAMPSPLGSDFSGSIADDMIAGISTLDAWASENIAHPVETPKRNVITSPIQRPGSHPISTLAPPKKRARWSVSPVSPKNCGKQLQTSPVQSARLSFSPSPIESQKPRKCANMTQNLMSSSQDADTTPTKRRRVPSISPGQAQMMMCGFQTNEEQWLNRPQDYSHEISQEIEKHNAVEALLKGYF